MKAQPAEPPKVVVRGRFKSVRAHIKQSDRSDNSPSHAPRSLRSDPDLKQCVARNNGDQGRHE